MAASTDERKTENLPEWKREEVNDLVAMIDSYESVGIVDITGIPSRQLQNMRRDLHGSAELRVSRNTLMNRAIDATDDETESRPGIEELTEFVSGQVGLIGTNDNPFGLYRQLEASKTPAPIGAGEVAPNDIVIPEGDTGVDPGPFVGELQQVGAAARIDDGSIHVTEDSTVLEAGEHVSDQLANVLSELGIEPKEVGLDLRSVHSDGVLFDPEDLAIDIGEYERDVRTAAARARTLSVDAAYPTDRTASTLVATATGEARSLGLQAAIESPDLTDDLVSTADGRVRALAARIDDEEALPEELRDVETAAPAEETEADESDEPTDEKADQPADGSDDEDEDDEGGDDGEGLGAMFG